MAYRREDEHVLASAYYACGGRAKVEIGARRSITPLCLRVLGPIGNIVPQPVGLMMHFSSSVRFSAIRLEHITRHQSTILSSLRRMASSQASAGSSTGNGLTPRAAPQSLSIVSTEPTCGHSTKLTAHVRRSDPATNEEIGTIPEMGLEETKEAIALRRLPSRHGGRRPRRTPTVRSTRRSQCRHQAANRCCVSILTGIINYRPTPSQTHAGAHRSILTPWNFPSAMITRKLGAALAAGCTAVIKPPPETPFSALALVELAKRAGIPDGVINVVTTQKNVIEVGKEMCENKLVRKVTFTGSTPVAKLLYGMAASTLKKVSLEAGGAAICKFRGSGQTCVCANRIYVQASIYDEFAARLADKIAKFKVGNGLDSTTHLLLPSHPPLRCPHHRPRQPRRNLRAVAALIKFTTEDEVVKLANSVDVGLAGYFYSRDVGRVWRVAEKLEVGMVGCNTGLISQAIIPFGGVKESGLGREGGHGITEYMNDKLIVFGGLGA
ncbi:succinate semialdehyde dehydrogenase NADP+ linked [Salix suchowensis]|nr:succinate semialdehyde dehydrogenase NADP+ linked [Salix suchowensis]